MLFKGETCRAVISQAGQTLVQLSPEHPAREEGEQGNSLHPLLGMLPEMIKSLTWKG